MAALAATGLTCCGGGGGGDNLEGSTIKFFEVGTSAGTMYVTVLSKSGANSSYTITRFGGLGQSKNDGEIVEHSTSKDPDVKIPDDATKVRHVSVSLNSYDDATNNREATGFYSSITGAATTNGNNGNNGNGGNGVDFDFPQTWITMMYQDNTSGTAHFTFKFKVDEDTIAKLQEMDEAERKKYMEEFNIDNEFYTTVSVDGYFHYEN